MATTRRLARKNDSRYFLQFAATASLLVAGTLALVLLVLPQRYVLSSGFREGNLALPDPSVPFEPPDPVVIAALPPLPAPSEVVRGPAEILWEQVLPLLAREEFERAIPMFAAYLELYPGDLDVRREYAITLLRAGYADRAIPVLESLLPAQNDRELRLLLARTLRDVGNVSGAAALYDALLRATPDDEDLVLEWARAHMSVEEYRRAEDVLASGLGAMPTSSLIRGELARIYFYTDRLEEAEAILLAMSDEEIALAGVGQLRADVIAALTPPADPEVDPPPPPTLLEQAVAAREDGDFALASELLEAALKADADDVDVWQALADLRQYELEDFAGALDALREVERLSSGGGIPMQYRMAQLEVWTDQYDDARSRLEALIDRMDEEEGDGDPSAAGVVVRQADVWALLGDLDRWEGLRLPAVRRYEAALALDANHERAREGLAILRAEADRQIVEIEEPRIGGIAETLADTDEFRRLDLGGEWYGISGDWVWGTRSGTRIVQGLAIGGGSSDVQGLFAEFEGARWWRWSTVRTALHFGVQNVRDSELDVSFGASARHVGAGGLGTEVRFDHAPAFSAINTLQAVEADVRQDRLFVAHTRPLNERWSFAASGEATSLSHSGVPGAERNLRLSVGASVGRSVSRSLTLGLAARGLRFTDASPTLGAGALYWDPNSSVSVGPYAQFTRPIGTWWVLNARVNPGVAWIDERSVLGASVVPDMSGSLGIRREGARYLTRVDLFYGQGRFNGYRSLGVNIGFSARGWFGRAGEDSAR